MSVKQVIKHNHKQLKSKVGEMEAVRNNDRTGFSWFNLRQLKKLKLKAKDKLNAVKQ
jgi:hypothetical protein|tara:strand:- start:247 stop:417 length:171 start_codon:yes stop_codon:yes gene_type:complete